MKKSISGVLGGYLEQRQQLASSLQNAGWMVFDRVLRGVLSVLIGSWVARYLGPGLYGSLAFVIAVAVFFQAVCNLGLDNLVVRAIAAGEAPDGLILGSTLAMRLTVGWICWGALTVYFWHASGPDDTELIIGSVISASLIFQASNTIDLWFISQMQSRRTTLAKVTAYGFSYGLRILFILTRRNIIWFAVATLCDYVIAAVLMVVFYQKSRSSQKWQASWSLIKRMLHESWYYMISGVGVITYMQIDQIYLGILRGKSELGVYSAVIRFASVWYFLPAMICASLMPLIVRKKAEGPKVYVAALRKLYLGFLVISVLITVTLVVLASPIIHALLGKAYSASEPALAIYAWSIIPVFLGNAHNLWMINDRIPHVMLARTVFGGVVALIAGYLLILHFGVVGAAVGGVLGYTASDIIAPVLLRPRFVMSLLGG